MFWKRKRQAVANTVAEIFNKHYCALRSEIQSQIQSGVLPRYSERKWLNCDDASYAEADLEQDVLYYKSNEAAFQSACYFAAANPAAGAVLPGIVEKVQTAADGFQQCTLSVASPDGMGRVLWCTTIEREFPFIAVGDLVAFHLVAAPTEFASSEVLGKVGFVVVKLAPVQSARRGWQVAK